MAPKRGESVERTEEHDNFIKRLAEYHEKRGTPLDPEPKVGVRHIDLFKLYQRVVEEGGYDLCSDTKAKPLMWRRLAEEFVGKNQYTAAQAFQIKNVYYKNLCAYEISEHWKKEPPPKEILEEVTAKGGNVMGRTLENFVRPPSKEERDLHGDGADGEGSPEQAKLTPKKEDGMDGLGDDPGSATGRTTRGLRQAPPQRVLFQPDAASGRQTRGAAQTSSPVPGGMGAGGMMSTSAMNGASSTLASYEPSQSYPLSLKSVVTPANNPEHYRQALKRKAEASAGPLTKKYRNIMLPGTGFIGPNIYVRAQMALQSGIPEEEEYALHHLVKISHERGDKYRFDQFPGLAEALLRKVMRACSLFYDVDWDVSYDEDFLNAYADADEELLNGLQGTSDIVLRLKSRIPKSVEDGLQDLEWRSELNRIMEAALVVRNMCLQRENAQYLISLPTTRDYLAVVLNLPPHPAIVELLHYALETAEQAVVWCDLHPHDSLYQALLSTVLEGRDRGAVTVALRALARIAMNLPGPKQLDEVPARVLTKVQAWLLVEDDELKSACLDFLFQYTSFSDNVETLLQTLDAEKLAQQLSRMLLYGAREEKHPHASPPRRKERDEDDRTPQPVPKLSRSIVEQLLKLEDPERSSEWLRMCFVADRDSEMTQISLWQAYQATFAPHGATHPHMIAGDFIKQVSTTFVGATAQVAGSNRYVIRGIRARGKPVETGVLPGSTAQDKGRELWKCGWGVTVSVDPIRDPQTGQVISAGGTRDVECPEWFRESESMLRHILKDHLHMPRKPADGDRMEVDPPASLPGSRPASAMAMANGHQRSNGTPAASATSLNEMFDFAAADKTTYRCRWSGCHRTSTDITSTNAVNSGNGKVSRTALFARHVQTHLPDPDAQRAKHNLGVNEVREGYGAERVVLQGVLDEKGDAVGVPLGAALVLRNVAKFMPGSLAPATSGGEAQRKVINGEKATSGSKEVGAGLMERVFGDEVVERLFFALTHGRPINAYVGSILRSLGRSEA